MSRVACLVIASLTLACHTPPPPVEHLRFVQLFAHGADDTSPLLVVLHGRGDTADNFARVWQDLPVKLAIAVADAPMAYGDGRQWYDFRPGMSDRDFATALGDAEARVWPAIAELAHGRKLLLAGFSQGANLTYLMATRHPDAIAYAFPFSGRLPIALTPPAGTHLAPVYALHGNRDQTIAIDDARRTIAAFQAIGGTAELHELDGVGHTIAPAMLDDFANHVAPLVTRPL
jgi:phospholipase/carboxylesterase